MECSYKRKERKKDNFVVMLLKALDYFIVEILKHLVFYAALIAMIVSLMTLSVFMLNLFIYVLLGV